MRRFAAFLGLLASLIFATPLPALAQIAPHRAPAVIAAKKVAATFGDPAVSFGPHIAFATSGALGSNGGADTSNFILAMTFKCSVGTNTSSTAIGQQNYTCYLTDFFGNLKPAAVTCDSETCPGLDLVFDNAGAYGTIRININASDTTAASPHGYQKQLTGIWPTKNNGWHTLVIAGDMNFANGSKRLGAYLDDVKQSLSGPGEQVAGGGAFTINWNSAAGFGLLPKVNSTAHPGNLEFGAIVLDTVTKTMPGCETFGDQFNHIVDSSGNICPAARHKVVNAATKKPAFINAAGDCRPWGRRADVCFWGDATTFLQNRGSATGTFAAANSNITGGLDAANVFDAPYGPIGPPGGLAYIAWSTGAQATSLTGSPTTFTGNGPISNNGGDIQANDLLVLQTTIAESSTSLDRNTACTLNGVSMTRQLHAVTASNWPITASVFTYVAQPGDAVAAGSDYTANSTLNCTYSNSSGVAANPRTAVWRLTVIRRKDGAAPTIQGISTAHSNGANQATVVTDSVTPTAAPALLLHFQQNYSADVTVPIPAGFNLVQRHYAGSSAGGFANNQISFRYVTDTGAQSVANGTMSGNNGYMTAQMVVQ